MNLSFKSKRGIFFLIQLFFSSIKQKTKIDFHRNMQYLKIYKKIKIYIDGKVTKYLK